MEFSDWISQKFIEWRGDRYGKGASVADFAKLFGTSQPLMSRWMQKGGPVPNSEKYITTLVNASGPEVYDVLGLPRPDALYGLPGETRGRLSAAINEIRAEYSTRRLDPESAEAAQIAEEIFRRHGFIVTDIQQDESGS